MAWNGGANIGTMSYQYDVVSIDFAAPQCLKHWAHNHLDCHMLSVKRREPS